MDLRRISRTGSMVLEYKNTENMMEILAQFIRSQIQDESAEQLIFFAQNYFRFSDFEEIADRSVEDLYGAVLSHWNLFLDLPAGSEKSIFITQQ